mmetsp:Transcript_6531/g.7488  ORF Transcript_6531/g.7488 Transcript_6531/m.7488 type:complete len:219 (-) Transcript_6531:426-1082(-)
MLNFPGLTIFHSFLHKPYLQQQRAILKQQMLEVDVWKRNVTKNVNGLVQQLNSQGAYKKFIGIEDEGEDDYEEEEVKVTTSDDDETPQDDDGRRRDKNRSIFPKKQKKKKVKSLISKPKSAKEQKHDLEASLAGDSSEDEAIQEIKQLMQKNSLGRHSSTSRSIKETKKVTGKRKKMVQLRTAARNQRKTIQSDSDDSSDSDDDDFFFEQSGRKTVMM